jgi:hypothetical protein
MDELSVDFTVKEIRKLKSQVSRTSECLRFTGPNRISLVRQKNLKREIRWNHFDRNWTLSCLILISHFFSSVELNSVGIELFVNMGYFINVFFVDKLFFTAESRSPAWPCNVELAQPSSKEYRDLCKPSQRN